MTGVPIRKPHEAQTHGKEGHVTAEAEIGMVQRKPRDARDRWASREARRRQGGILPQSL